MASRTSNHEWSKSLDADFFLIKPTDALISQIYFVKKLYVFRAGIFHCTFGTGICHAGLMSAFMHDHPGRA